MNNLAEVPGDQGKYEQAEEKHRQALRLIHTGEYEQPRVIAEPSGQVRTGGRDASTLGRAKKKKRKGLFRYRSSLMDKCPQHYL
jgi:hypothetical protein